MALALPRRDFLRGMLAFAAPAIVSSANIMPVKMMLDDVVRWFPPIKSEGTAVAFGDDIVFDGNDVLRFECFRELLLPGLLNIVSKYEYLPSEWERVFNSTD